MSDPVEKMKTMAQNMDNAAYGERLDKASKTLMTQAKENGGKPTNEQLADAIRSLHFSGSNVDRFVSMASDHDYAAIGGMSAVMGFENPKGDPNLQKGSCFSYETMIAAPSNPMHAQSAPVMIRFIDAETGEVVTALTSLAQLDNMVDDVREAFSDVFEAYPLEVKMKFIADLAKRAAKKNKDKE